MRLPENPFVGIAHPSAEISSNLHDAFVKEDIEVRNILPEDKSLDDYQGIMLGLLSEQTTNVMQLDTQVPYIILGSDKSKKMHEESAIIYITYGANGYTPENEAPDVIVERAKAILRRFNQIPKEPPTHLVFDDLVIDLKGHTVMLAGSKVELRNMEFKVLSYFTKNPEIVISRDELLKMVWGLDFIGESKTVDVQVNTLRGKIGKERIDTYRGKGYKFKLNGKATPSLDR